MRDFKRMQTDPPEGVNGAPLDNDIMQWHAVIFGPEDTPWEDGTFKLSVDFCVLGLQCGGTGPWLPVRKPGFHAVSIR